MPSFTFIISIAGIAYSVTVAICNFSDPKIKSTNDVYQYAFDDLFVLLNAALSIIAWLLFLSTAGTTTPLVAALFIAAEAVFIFKEIITFALFNHYQVPLINRDVRFDISSPNARFLIEVDAHQKRAWVNLLSSILLTLITAGWCTVPESIIVGAFSLFAMGLVYWKKQDVTTQIERQMEHAVQVINKATPWWASAPDIRNETTVQPDVMASNDALDNRGDREDWPYRNAPVSGKIRQMRLFDRKVDINVGQDAFVSNHQHGRRASNRHVSFHQAHS